MSFLEIKNLNKKYRNIQVLNNVSFSMDEGQILSIIGSSGNGKTTLLRCLNLLETPEEGSIILRDTEILTINRKKEKGIFNNHFGLVFQNYNLFPQYTVLNNVLLPLKLYEKKRLEKGLNPLYNESAKEISINLLKEVGLYNKINNYPYQLSGGQQQRVAIARALVLRPDVLCFDEPTSALDPKLTEEISSVIKSTNKTTIIVTHDMEFAKKVSDRIIFMSDGTIIEEGNTDEIFNNPKNELTKNFLRNYIKE